MMPRRQADQAGRQAAEAGARPARQGHRRQGPGGLPAGARALAVAMAADPDGEANDIRLMPDAVPRARARIAGSRLWVADRQFCDLNQPALLTEEGRPLPAAPLAESWLPRRPRPAGAGVGRCAGPAGRRAVGLDRGGEGEAAAVRAADPPDPPRRGGRVPGDRPARRDALSGRRPAGGLPEAVGDRARVPEDHRGLPPGAADRQHAGGDDLPGVVLPGAVQPAAGDARATWRPARRSWRWKRCRWRSCSRT